MQNQRRLIQRASKVHQSQSLLPLTLTVTASQAAAVTVTLLIVLSQSSTTSTWVLWPRVSIIYNETILSWIHRRPQVMTFYNISIPFSPVMRSHHQALILMCRSHQLQKLRPILPQDPWSYHQQEIQRQSHSCQSWENSPMKPMLNSPCRPGQESPVPEMTNSLWDGGVTNCQDEEVALTSPKSEPWLGMRCDQDEPQRATDEAQSDKLLKI